MIATQHYFTGIHPLKVDPRGRITLPKEVVRDLEEKVVATVLGDPELMMNEFGVRYQNQWVYMVTKANIRARIKEIIGSVQKEDAEAPDVFYKQALLNARILINPAEEAQKVILRYWSYEEEGKQREYTTMELNLDVLLAHIRKREEQDRKYIPERVTEKLYMSAQRERIEAQGRLYIGKEHEILRAALETEERKLL
ncbi:MAG: hypothetical protein AABX98_05840, partial [Nanoarchaeota archaeon]